MLVQLTPRALRCIVLCQRRLLCESGFFLLTVDTVSDGIGDQLEAVMVSFNFEAIIRLVLFLLAVN